MYILFLAFFGFIIAYVIIKPLIIQKIFKNHPKLIEIKLILAYFKAISDFIFYLCNFK